MEPTKAKDTDKVDVAGKIRSGARWLSAAKLLSQVYSWALTILVMRLLTPDAYGLMAMAMVVISFVGVFEDLGFRVKLIQMAEYTERYARAVYGLVLISNCAVAALLVAGSPLAADFFNQDAVAPVIAVLAIQPILAAVASIPEATLMRALDFPKIAVIDMLRVIVSSTLTLWLASLGFGVWALVWGNIAATVVRTVGLVIVSPFWSLPSFRFKELGDTFKFGGLVLAQRLVGQVYAGADRLLVGRFLDARALGLYDAGAQIAALPLEKVGGMLNTLSFTGLSRVTDDRSVFRHYVLRSAKVVSLLLFPAFFGLSAVAAEFVPLVMGPGWVGMERVAAIFAFCAPARSLSIILLESLNSLGRPELHLRCMIVNAVLYVVAALAGLSVGIEGVAVGIVIASVLTFVYHFTVAAPLIGISWREVALATMPALLAGTVMFAAVVGLREVLPFAFPSVEGLLASVAAGAVVYTGLILAADRDSARLVRSVLINR